MLPSASTTGNPFLSDDEDDSYWVKTKCRMPHCHEDTAQGHLACLFHLQSSISPKPTKSLDRGPSQGSLQPSDIRPDAGPSPSRKNVLDAKFILRKSAAPARQPRPPFHPADSRVNHGLSTAQDRLTNGHAKSPLQRPPDQAPLDSPARKRQRILSPRNDDSGFDSAPSDSPLAFPSAFLVQNGDSNIPCPTKLPTLNGDLHPFAPAPVKGQERTAIVYSSYGDYLRTPIKDLFGAQGNLGSTTLPLRTTPSPRSDSRNGSLEGPQKPKTTPTRATSTRSNPSRTRIGQNEKASPTAYTKLRPVARTPPLEKQRRRLAEQDISNLDAYVYGQQGSSEPPPGVERRHEPPEPKQQDNVFYAHIDPRIHRGRPHSSEWYQQKEAEIKARGGRKANFGKAIQRMKEQRLKKGPENFEASLPDRVRHNEDWVSALRWFESGGREGVAAAQTAATSAPMALATPVRTKRPYNRRKPFVSTKLDKKASGQDP